MKQIWAKRLMVAGIVLLVAGGYMILRAVVKGPLPAGELKTVTEVHDDKPLPDFRLAGPKGAFSNANLLGKWSFVFFGYTQCPDICPTALGLMKELQAKFGAVPPVPTFQVVFISVDPARDTHALLGNYLAAFDPAFIGVTGNDDQLAPLTKDLGVFIQRNDAVDKTNYTVDHSAAIYLVDPKGRLVALFSPPQVAEKMAADFRRITAR
jgi:protein SCO1/2